MADLSVTPVSTGIKPQQQMSLGDLMNIASSAQAYQQAQQLNPIQLQAAQAKLRSENVGADIAEQTKEPKIQSAKAEATRFQNEADKSGVDLKNHYQNIATGVYGGYLTDPDFINGNAPKMIEKLDRARDYLISNGVPEHGSKMHDQLVDLAKKDPKEAYQQIKNSVQIAGGNASQFTAQQPQLTTVNGQPATFAAVGGVTPVLNAAAPAPAPTPSAVSPQQMNLPQHSQPVPLPYPVRQPGVPYAKLPQEDADTTNGTNYKTSLVARQSELPMAKRNIDETMDAIEKISKQSITGGAGIPGNLERKIRTALGDTSYVQLSKDLANQQIANLKASGGSMDTVSGQHLQKIANGDETYPLDVLKNIAGRTKSDMTNLDMQANGAQVFSNRFGDNNMNAFKQMWSKNADSKIFEAINIMNDITDPDKRKAEWERILPTDPEKRKVFLQKYRNIKKLSETGSLQ